MRPGFVVVDKPPGITSHDVVGTLRAILRERRVGHTGTLDPFATGVLVVAVGPATRLISFLDEGAKVYEATLRLGARTATGDLDGEVTATAPVPPLDGLDAALAARCGVQDQRPPAYSAVKLHGRPLYSYARAGVDVEVDARSIRVDELRCLGVHGADVRLRAVVSRGTYVRTLGEAIAADLGTVGHLVALRRLQSGPFDLTDAVTWPELSALLTGDPDWRVGLRSAPGVPRVPWGDRGPARDHVLARLDEGARAFAGLPARTVAGRDRERLLAGGVAPPGPEGRFLLRGEDGAILALCEGAGGQARALRVLPPEPAPSP
jgi:tRNA pseudouridine55 synthase